MIKCVTLLCCLFISNVVFVADIKSAEIKIAVASNFKATAQKIADKFSHKTNHKITLISGSSSSLLSMIVHGSPIDIFLSADKARPLRLIEMKLADKKSLTNYANGQLAFLSPNVEIASINQIIEHLKTQSGKLAIANPRLAPYGLSSINFINESVIKNNNKQTLKSTLVMGNNVIQAMQFVTSNNAQSGFVSYSQIKQANVTEHFYVLPKGSYTPIEQYGIITNKGSKNSVVTDLMSFIKNDSKQIISNAGYLVDNLNDQ